MKIHKIEQGSEEWFDLRKGRITGSTASKVVPIRKSSKKKVGWYQVVADNIAIEPIDEDPRDRGHRLEGEARELLAKQLGSKIEEVGFVSVGSPLLGVSPDGLIGHDQVVEIKCPLPARHLQNIYEHRQNAGIPKDYKLQLLHTLTVMPKLRHIHFVSFCPEVTALPYLYIHADRDSLYEELEAYEQQLGVEMAEMNKFIIDLGFRA